MKTQYIKFCQQHNDSVLGSQAITWITTSLVRVTRNRLQKAHFEWVGNASMQFDLDEVRKLYPLALYV